MLCPALPDNISPIYVFEPIYLNVLYSSNFTVNEISTAQIK